ncbi:Mom family adenine methylcarbamoylation protein [Azospirillum sp. sgz302134]
MRDQLTLDLTPPPAARACQRWTAGRASYRSAGEPIDPRRYGVEEIDEGAARAFVMQHHYSGSYPAALFRVGLFRTAPFRRAELVGTAVFSVPMNPNAVAAHAGTSAGCELGRFVLVDEVEANGESHFLARAFDLLAALRDGGGAQRFRAVLSYSDPVPRSSVDGAVTLPGHVGVVYQASNARYVGRSEPRTHILDQAGRIISPRALTKLRKDERGAAYAYERLRVAGAPPRLPFESGRDYVRRALAEGPFRRLKHNGNHTYVFAVGDRRTRWDTSRTFAPALPYPKKGLPVAE